MPGHDRGRWAWVGWLAAAAWPLLGLAAQPVAEVRVVEGAPTLFIRGQPAPPLLFFTEAPQAPVKVEDGRVTLQRPVGEELLSAAVPAGSPLTVEVAVNLQEGYMDDATASVRACLDGRTGAAYMLGLQFLGSGNRVKLWKHDGTNRWQTWFTNPLPWRVGQEVRLRLTVAAGHVAGWVDGQLVAEQDDPEPLPAGDVALGAYGCRAGFRDPHVQAAGHDVVRGFGEVAGLVGAPWRGGGGSAERMRSFAAHGVRLFTYDVPTGDWWRGPGQYQFAGVGQALQNTATAVPDALALLRVTLNPPDWWLTAHPEQRTRLRSRDGEEWTAPWAAMGSALWRQEAGEALAALVGHVSGLPVAQHILGWHVGAGDCGEWSYAWGEGCGDYSAAQQAAFVGWLTARYGTDTALQAAWHQPTATLAAASVPPPARRYHGALGGLHDPRQAADVIDYLRFHSQACAESVCYLARIAKAACGRQHLVGAFYGYWIATGWRPGSWHNAGHHDLAQVLACPDIDFVCDPYSYRDRGPGAGWVGQAPQAAITQAGKLHLCEDDTRTFLTPDDAAHSFGRCPDRETTVGVLQRNWAGAVTGGGGLWWMEQGPGWFEDPAVLPALGRLQAVHAGLTPAGRTSAAEIALVIDERSADCLAQTDELNVPLLADQAIGCLNYVGAPYDVLLASQLATARDYKVYLLPQAYAPDAETRVLLQALRRPGRTLVWVHAPGFLTPAGPSAEAASDLTGMQLALRQIGGSTFVTLAPQAGGPLAALPGGYTYGTHSRTGPLLEVIDPAAQVWGLARCTSANVLDGVAWPLWCYQGAGLAAKTVDGARVIVSATGPLPAPLLREIARSAGVHVYSAEGDYVAASRTLVAVHAAFSGTHHVRLPRPAKVTDALTGVAVGTGLTELTVPLRLGQTAVWLVE